MILDPIDGTRGFLKGSEALYVVGLALVVDGEVVLSVMGCPNWQEDPPKKSTSEVWEHKNTLTDSGVVMFAHDGCGTWRRHSSFLTEGIANVTHCWNRCFVDQCCSVHEACFSIPDSQTWESLPLSALFSATTDADNIGDNHILLLPTCCGSLCKYLMVASGRASVFILRSKVQKTIKAWDHAVGIICVREAGGKVTDWRGTQVDIAADQDGRRLIFPSGGVLVTNGKLHNHILEMIS